MRAPVALLQALGLALVIVMVEYFARLCVAKWIPILGATRFNDMLISAVFYGLLVLMTVPRERLHFHVFRRTLREIAAYARTEWVWVGLALAATR